MLKTKIFRRTDTWRRALCLLCILSMYSLSAFAQQRITGTVTDATGEPVIGANVVEKGVTANGTITDADGKFTLTVKAGATLTVSYVGYVSQDVLVGAQTVLNITLAEDLQALEEVVIIGYGTQKKANLSGSVSVIPAKALENRPVTNVNTAMQGLAANVNITRPSGRPSAVAGINIRGFTSINGGEAFILVDNVPTTATELARINPSDIESISILKDAAAAAIYGGRSAFGVVLVTTKTAKSDKIQVSADYTYGIKQFDNLPETLYGANTPEYMRLANIVSHDPNRYNAAAIAYMEARVKDPSLPEIIGPGRENGGVNDRQINDGEWEYYGMYNLYDVMLRKNSANQTANFSVSQRGERLAYAASGGFYTEEGMLNYGNEDYRRFNFRGNASYKLTGRWTLGTNIAFNRLDQKSSLDRGEGDFWFYRLHSNYPTQPLYNPDGTWTQDGGNNVGSVTAGRIISIEDRTTLSFNTKFDILKDVWTLNADATFKTMNYDEDAWGQATPYENKPGKNSSRNLSSGVSASRNYERQTVYNLYTNFNKTFAEKHSIGAMAGYNQEEFVENKLGVVMNNLITMSLPNIMLAQEGLTRGQSISELALRGVFGRLNYIFDNRYILEANGRYDGSSRFRKGQRFGFFPSFSAAWVASQEAFMESLGESIQLSNLKLRGSYGSLGNQNLDYNYYPTYANMGQYQTGILIDGSRPFAMSTPGVVTGGLTWETVRTVNGGIDLGFLKNRLTVEIDVYTRYTENMLTASGALPDVFGAGSPTANAADLKTKGWELTLGWRDAVQLAGSPLNYGVRFLLADNRTRITRFDNNPDKRLGEYYEGQELGELWGYTTLGYFESDAEVAAWADQSALGNSDNNYMFYRGDLKFEDVNGDGKVNNGSNTLAEHGDLKLIGNNRERFPYSLNLDADWKGFDLRLFFQGVGKRDAYPTTAHNGIFFWGLHGVVWANGNTKNLDRWTEENPSQDAFFPRIKSYLGNDGELAKVQTRYLQDASYMRLKNLTLGYTLPSQLTQKWKVNNLRVFFSGENLFTFHHIQVKGNDPEKFGDGTAIYYPYQHTWSFGLNIGF